VQTRSASEGLEQPPCCIHYCPRSPLRHISMREITSTRKHDDETRELKCPIDELECSSDETGVLKCQLTNWRAQVTKLESTSARSGGTREHMSAHRAVSMKKRRPQELVPEVRENTCRSHRADTAGRWGGGGMGVKTRPIVIVLVCGE
jgi:hypothetical protein